MCVLDNVGQSVQGDEVTTGYERHVNDLQAMEIAIGPIYAVAVFAMTFVIARAFLRVANRVRGRADEA